MGSILPKNERNYQNIGKKIIIIKKIKKRKEKNNTEPSLLRKIESNHANNVTPKFQLAIITQQRKKALTFIQTKV